ncbi:MAG TPA: NAD(P)/FAD-dependent oxidoreductase [Gaiellales bacterium]|nr:NAD(P)/FAD-dependent oxidoreductase [Gaiellales bacterium]
MNQVAESNEYDVLIVGAGPAGLNAALVLGRMRRRVLVVDTDAPAHAVSRAVHGFLAQDGTPPSDLRRVGRQQLGPYTTVELRHVSACAARKLDDDAFALQLADDGWVTGRRLLLAHGMHYGLPAVTGLAELWGTNVFHCPYCHGWEVQDQRLAVYGSGERAVHQALLLTSLSNDVAVFCDSPTAFSIEQERQLAAAGIDVRTEHVERIDERDGGMHIVLHEHSPVARDALFIQPQLALASDLAVTLGAELTDTGTVAIDPTGQSSVPGLYIGGDAATPVQSVAVATGSGARAAYAINASLLNQLPESRHDAQPPQTRTSAV